MRVLHSFMLDSTPATTPPPPVAPAPGPTSAPFGAAPVPPPPVNAPGAAFVSSQAATRSNWTGTSNLGSGFAADFTINVPGLGAVNPQQMQVAGARVQAVIHEALGGGDLAHLTPADAQAAQARLDGMRAAGRLTDEQYAALTEGLAVFAGGFPA